MPPDARPHDNADEAFDAPYPLRRLFLGQAMPLFVVLLVAVSALAAWGGSTLMRSIYLELASRRAIDAALGHEVAVTWKTLASSTDPQSIYATTEGQRLLRILRNEQRELGLARLKIYGAGGLLLFATDESRIGERDPSDAYRRAAVDGERSAVRKAGADGVALYELYVPFAVAATTGTEPQRLVFELYEPVGQLDTLLARTGGLAIGLPAALLIVLALTVNRMVEHAQRDIDWRTKKLGELRGRLERLLSRSAAEAARRAIDGGGLASEAIDCTLLYSDIRGFTQFSEQHSPAEVVAFLNRAMAMQVDAIDDAGGDVDKMIGDAVLVRFDGADREARAVAAATTILRGAAEQALPRDIGIGIFSGPVISGAIGPPNRQDFTVIGDSVNVAARLCSAAAAGELVMDHATATAAGIADPGTPDSVVAKGKAEPISVIRWAVATS